MVGCVNFLGVFTWPSDQPDGRHACPGKAKSEQILQISTASLLYAKGGLVEGSLSGCPDKLMAKKNAKYDKPAVKFEFQLRWCHFHAKPFLRILA